MTSTFAITPTPPTVIKLEPGEDGVFSFTVTSLAAPDRSFKVLLEALLVGPDGKGKEADWLVVGPSRTLTMMGGETYTVTITAKPTHSSPRGESAIKLAVAEEDRPHDAYAYSAPVTCEVVVRMEPPPPRPKLPKWLIPALIAGAVVLAGAGIAIWKLASSGGGCDEGASKPCLLASCSGVQRCSGGTWSPCAADDPMCPSRPANDSFAFAQPLSGLPTAVSGTTQLATREHDEPDHYTTNPADAGAWVGEHSVWYRWTAPSGIPPQVTVDVCATAIDTIVAVYRGGNDVGSLSRVTDNNNACGTGWGSRLVFPATPGVTYYLAVGDAGGAMEGAFTLKLN